MGELIFSIFIGLWTFCVGLYMYMTLDKEEKKMFKKLKKE